MNKISKKIVALALCGTWMMCQGQPQWSGNVTVLNNVKPNPACKYENATINIFDGTSAGGIPMPANSKKVFQYPTSGLGLGIQENVWVACTDSRCHQNPDNTCYNLHIKQDCSGSWQGTCAYYGPDGSGRISIQVSKQRQTCTVTLRNATNPTPSVTPNCCGPGKKPGPDGTCV